MPTACLEAQGLRKLGLGSHAVHEGQGGGDGSQRKEKNCFMLKVAVLGRLELDQVCPLRMRWPHGNSLCDSDEGSHTHFPATGCE